MKIPPPLTSPLTSFLSACPDTRASACSRPSRRRHLGLITAGLAGWGLGALPAAHADVLPFDASRHAGRVVYLDFWASWCAPCLQSFPWMSSLHARFGPRGLSVVAVNLDRDRGAADRFLAKASPTFEIVFDPKGDSARAFQVSGMPNSFLLDRAGRIVHRHVGFRIADQPDLEARIDQLLSLAS